MANNPQQKVFEDPLHEKEIFASEVVGVAFVHGNVIITLANARIEGAGEGKPARLRHVISSKCRRLPTHSKPSRACHANRSGSSSPQRQTSLSRRAWAFRSAIGQRGNLITRPPSSDRATFGVHNARSRPPLFERVAIVSRARASASWPAKIVRWSEASAQ